MSERLRADVEYLCDSLRAGRATGTPGANYAASYVYGRFRDAGLNPVLDFFHADSLVARNVEGTLESRNSSRYIIIVSYYDGFGVLDGKMYPGADSNASGVAALLEIADRLAKRGAPSRNVLFVALDAHNVGMKGSEELWRSLSRRRITREKIDLVVNLDILGCNLNPVDRCWKDYLIALGGERYEDAIASCNHGLGLHLYYDYYGSRQFTNLFYRRMGEQKVFLEHGVPGVMFTSGISMNTNRETDTPETLNYFLFERRVTLIGRWLERML